MLTMTQAHDIRKAYFEEGMTLSAVAAKHHVDRKTVRKYLDREDFNAPPPRPRQRPFAGPNWSPIGRRSTNGSKETGAPAGSSGTRQSECMSA